MIEHIVPAGVGVHQYTVRRDRAERSFVSLEYYDQTAGRWIVDNVQDPPEHKNIDINIPLIRPQAFLARDQPFIIRLSGQWMPDNEQHIDMDHIVTAQFKDRVEFFMYAKDVDPSATVVARILYTKDIPLP